ncbi:protein asteroid homolog 1 [Chanos chanos]|uniref:Protein asteroid homolog 1 n=1 Tax=Chanos chanos TaxID=29144 RepID=A0A6J2WPD3_CHACN|nr:protein asteroid homolog 1 [Chanos chanos]
MGVHGLTSYVEGNRHFFTDLRLRDSRLVIDGCSLYFRLYFSSGLDQQKGGDYDTFADVVRQFFLALSTCKLHPFIVLDGGIDQTEKKFTTLRERAQSKIQEAHALSRGAHGSVLPLLTREVFKQVLSELGIPVVQCVSEADWEIACLANQWGCPVLTNDSDFYIFDLRGGYLPFAFFEWSNINGKASERYIPARRFTVNRFCSNFNHMNKQLLPLFAVIAGNDYTPAKTTEMFFSRVELFGGPPMGRQGGARGRRANPRIEGLLLWLSQFPGPAEAVEEVLEVLGGKQRGSQRKLLSDGMQDYHLSPTSSLALYFSGSQQALLSTQGLPTVLASQPEWLLRGLTCGRLPPLVLDVLVLHRALLICQVENSRLPSTHTTSQSIRQAFYSLLLRGGNQQGVDQSQQGRGRGGRGRGGQRRGRGGPHKDRTNSDTFGSYSTPSGVEEYDRHDLTLRRTVVEAQLPSTVPLLQLNTLDQLPIPGRRQVLLGVLGVADSVLQGVPVHLCLPVCVTCFWMSAAKPKPSASLLHALLLGFVYGELCRCRSLPKDPASSCAGVRSVCTRLARLRVKPGERRGLDLGVAYSLCQWQSCMWAGLYLNQLLCFPLPEPQCAWVFSGTLLHGLELALRTGSSAESLLADAALPMQLFSCLQGAVMSSSVHSLGPSSCSAAKHSRGGQRQTQQRGRGRAGRGRGNRGRGRGNHRNGGAWSADDLDNRFALLVTGEDEDEE